jgi:hypothetical protein
LVDRLRMTARKRAIQHNGERTGGTCPLRRASRARQNAKRMARRMSVTYLRTRDTCGRRARVLSRVSWR